MDDAVWEELVAFFDGLYPAGPGHWPYWKQEPHRRAFFDIARSAHDRGLRIHGDEVLATLQQHWLPDRDDVDANDRAVIREMCAAWSEWLYALDQLDGSS